jgi:hypothetical protein
MKRKIKFKRLHWVSPIYSDGENCCVFWGVLSEKEKESKEIYEGDVPKGFVVEIIGNVYENPELINKQK